VEGRKDEEEGGGRGEGVWRGERCEVIEGEGGENGMKGGRVWGGG